VNKGKKKKKNCRKSSDKSLIILWVLQLFPFLRLRRGRALVKVGFRRGQGRSGPRAPRRCDIMPAQAVGGAGRGTVGRIAQLVEQRTEKSLLTHFTPFLSIAWTLTKPLILLAKTVFCPFSPRPQKIIKTDMKLAQQLAQTGKVLSPLV
jgi:hypothetical protein